MEPDELEAYTDDAVAYLGDEPDMFIVSMANGIVGVSFSFTQMIDDALNEMETEREEDDMLALSRHLIALGNRVRQAVKDSQTRGEEP